MLDQGYSFGSLHYCRMGFTVNFLLCNKSRYTRSIMIKKVEIHRGALIYQSATESLTAAMARSSMLIDLKAAPWNT